MLNFLNPRRPMGTPAESRPQVEFSEFRLDLRSGDLWRNGERVALQHQSFQILSALLRQPGQLVTREELVKQLWASDVFVDFEGSLNKAIKRLRETLNDSADEPRFIETIPRRGYRFIAPVEEVEAPTTESASLIGKKVSHYRVLEVIGGGGMGMVYKAEDLKLGRRVALKFLPDEMLWDTIALQRFEREARAASSLDHSNICTIYEVEEHVGQPFIVMQLLQGETLRDRLAALAADHKTLTLDELLEIAIQMCDGLQAAHDKGIIHRDIKPANIFLTSTGQVKILDFGLAKLVGTSKESESDGLEIQPGATAAAPQPARLVSPDATLTRLGVAMGTAGYMSPEQVRGEKLDARTDLFSFGLVLYEMATGQRAFNGETAAVVREAILNNSPVPVRELNTTLPPTLVATIDRALEKDREQRCQSAAEIRRDLEEVHGAETSFSFADWKWPAAAVALLAVAIVAGSVYWRSRSSVKLTDTDTIVLADFNNQTSDPVFDDALNTALRVELEQTPFLNLLSSDKVRGTLKQMNHSENEKLTRALARDVCLHTNSKAVIQGTISDAGNRYDIELRAENCKTGKTLARTKLEVNERNQIVKTLGMGGNQLREELGEPQATLQKFNQPLETATSSSLEALQAFAQGWLPFIEKGPSAGIPFYRRAVELDPTFADAYGYLGVVYGDLEENDLAVQNLKRAYELRDRVTQRQRYLIESLYETFVTGDIGKSVQILSQMVDNYPRYWVAHNNLSADLMELGRYEQAAAQAREALRLDPNSSFSMRSLMRANISLNLLDDAKAVYEAAQSRNVLSPGIRVEGYEVAFVQGDKAAMAEQLKWATGKLGVEDQFVGLQGDTEAYSGRIATAREFTQRAVESASRAGTPQAAAQWRAGEALREAMIGNADRARKKGEEALRLSSGQQVTAIVGLALALAGDTAQAQSIADSLNQQHPQDTMLQNFWLPNIYAALNLQKNTPGKALDALDRAIPYAWYDGTECLNPIYLRGLAYLQAGQGQQAASELQKITEHPELAANCLVGALSRLQLGRAQVMMGDEAAARRSYQDFLTLWKDADPDIPIYKEAKAEYAKLQ